MKKTNNYIYSENIFWPYHIPEMLALGIYFLSYLIIFIVNNGVIFDELDWTTFILPTLLPLIIINFSVVFLRINDTTLSFQYGIVSYTSKFDINKIQSIQIVTYKYSDFIGYDTPVGFKNWQHVYLLPAINPRGIEFMYLKKDNTVKRYFMSVNNPEQLIEAIKSINNNL